MTTGLCTHCFCPQQLENTRGLVDAFLNARAMVSSLPSVEQVNSARIKITNARSMHYGQRVRQEIAEMYRPQYALWKVGEATQTHGLATAVWTMDWYRHWVQLAHAVWEEISTKNNWPTSMSTERIRRWPNSLESNAFV